MAAGLGAFDDVGEPDCSPGDDAARAVPGAVLFRCLSGPGERGLRSPHHEQGFGPDPDGVRVRGRHLLHRLFHLRSALQPVPGEVWRAEMDRPDHAELGHPLRGDGFHHRRIQLLYGACAAGLCRGRVLPRDHLLPDTLVSRRRARPHYRVVHGSDPAFLRDRRACFRPAARARRRHGPAWLAVAVFAGGCAGNHPVRRRLFLSDGQAGGRALAGCRRTRLG